jgi:hypothetical protein
MAFGLIEIINTIGNVSFGMIGPEIIALLVLIMLMFLIEKPHRFTFIALPMSFIVANLGFMMFAPIQVLLAVIFGIAIYQKDGFYQNVPTGGD